MDFELSEDLKMVKSLAHDFVVEQLRPLERGLMGRSADLKDARALLDDETERGLIRIAIEVGLWGSSVPEEMGGAGLGTLANCLIEEELAQTVVPFDLGDVSPILFDASQGQRQKYLTPVLNHEKSVYIGILEPYSTFPELRTEARRDDRVYILRGEKLCRAKPVSDYFAVVFASSEKGPTAFFVDKDTPGFETLGETDLSWKPNAPVILTFRECPIPASNMLGEEGQAFSLGRKWLPSRRIVRGARAIGVAQRLLEDATTRAQTWESFGRPMAERASVQSALAEIATDIRACRLLVYEAALKSDSNVAVRNEASMVKLFATRMIQRATDRVSHIYGGPVCIGGFLSDTSLGDVAGTVSADTSLDLQARIISNELLKGLKF